jgi:hypothetical protein
VSAIFRLPVGWKADPDSPMPPKEQARHKSLCEAASQCYKRRDRAWKSGLLMEGHDFQAIGDIYFAQAGALLAEWQS